jgi:hypothetical protein
MKYISGQLAALGDQVALGDGAVGEIVCSLDTDEFSPQFPKASWAYLKQGVLVDFPQFGLIHYKQAEPGLRLLGRAASHIENRRKEPI